MLDEKDLQAIAAMLAPIKKDLEDVKADVAKLESKVDKLEAGQERMKNELKTELSHEFNALLEVHVGNQLKTLADGHALIIEQMAKKEELDDAKEVIHSLLDVLKIVVRQHSEEIKELKKAQ